MGRHRGRLKQLYNLKPKAHALCSMLTHGRPAIAEALDFFPEYGVPSGALLLHDSTITSPMAAPRYAEELAKNQDYNKEAVLGGEGIPAFPGMRRLIWEARDIYVPGHLIAPVDRSTGRIASYEKHGATNWSITRPRPFRKPAQQIAGRSMSFLRMKHYGHLLTDVLGPIAFAVEQGLVTPENPVTMIVAARDNPVALNFVEGMRNLGLARDVVRLEKDESAICETFLQCEVLVSSGEHRYAMPEATDTLRRIFSAGCGVTAPASPVFPKVYVSRGTARLRQVEGEAELIAELKARGWHVFESSWQNHAEQIAVFSNFETLVGVHGAGLANLIFGQPGARIIELQAQDARKTTGLFWASAAGLDYASIYGGAEGPLQSFSIEPHSVLRSLDDLGVL